jgi:hypothetical protein
MQRSQEQGSANLGRLLEAVGHLNIDELETLMSEVVYQRAKRNAPSLSKEETDLLLKLNQGVPPCLRKRFEELNEKRLAETLGPSEQSELVDLAEKVETINADRIGLMVKLARSKGVTLTKVVEDLDLSIPSAASESDGR